MCRNTRAVSGVGWCRRCRWSRALTCVRLQQDAARSLRRQPWHFAFLIMAALSIGGIFLVIMALAHGVNCCYPGARWGFSIDGFWMPPALHLRRSWGWPCGGSRPRRSQRTVSTNLANLANLVPPAAATVHSLNTYVARYNTAGAIVNACPFLHAQIRLTSARWCWRSWPRSWSSGRWNSGVRSSRIPNPGGSRQVTWEREYRGGGSCQYRGGGSCGGSCQFGHMRTGVKHCCKLLPDSWRKRHWRHGTSYLRRCTSQKRLEMSRLCCPRSGPLRLMFGA